MHRKESLVRLPYMSQEPVAEDTGQQQRWQPFNSPWGHFLSNATNPVTFPGFIRDYTGILETDIKARIILP